ncbi:MAG TPA: DUF2171 domain-containing protein [Gaiellaceae bacterium]
MSGDPVSWLMIERGWRVVDSAGEEFGHVDQVAGDAEADIFSGLVVSTGLLSGHRYVPAEQVGTIIEGSVQLHLTRDEAKHLAAHNGPGAHG